MAQPFFFIFLKAELDVTTSKPKDAPADKTHAVKWQGYS